MTTLNERFALLLESTPKRLYSNQPVEFGLELVTSGKFSVGQYLSLTTSASLATHVDDITLGMHQMAPCRYAFDAGVLAQHNTLTPIRYTPKFFGEHPDLFAYVTGMTLSADLTSFVSQNRKRLQELLRDADLSEYVTLEQLLSDVLAEYSFEREVVVHTPMTYTPGCVISVTPDGIISPEQHQVFADAGIKVLGQKILHVEAKRKVAQYSARVQVEDVVAHLEAFHRGRWNTMRSWVGTPVNVQNYTQPMILADLYAYGGGGKYRVAAVVSDQRGNVVDVACPIEFIHKPK